MDDRWIVVRFPVGASDFSILQIVQQDCGSHLPVSHPVTTGGSSTRVRLAEAWSWVLSSIYCRGKESTELYLHAATRLHSVIHNQARGNSLPFFFDNLRENLNLSTSLWYPASEAITSLPTDLCNRNVVLFVLHEQKFWMYCTRIRRIGRRSFGRNLQSNDLSNIRELSTEKHFTLCPLWISGVPRIFFLGGGFNKFSWG